MNIHKISNPILHHMSENRLFKKKEKFNMASAMLKKGLP